MNQRKNKKNVKYFDFGDSREQEEYLQEQYKNYYGHEIGINEDGEDEYTVYLREQKQEKIRKIQEIKFTKKMIKERNDELKDIKKIMKKDRDHNMRNIVYKNDRIKYVKLKNLFSERHSN
jgi:hypothetical protein